MNGFLLERKESVQETRIEVQEVGMSMGFTGTSYNSVDIGMPWLAIMSN